MPSSLRLAFCVAGIYASFLSWALIQERLSTTPYYGIDEDGNQDKPRYFRHVVFLNTIQSSFSACAALLYILFKRKPGTSIFQVPVVGTTASTSNGHSLNDKKNDDPVKPATRQLPFMALARCFQCAVMHSIGSPFGYAALRYIDYPTQILGKSCKLVPVMLMNIILYRRKFATHKYIVVSTVTAGISMFMLYAPSSGKGKSHGTSSTSTDKSLLGIGLLLVSLIIDGAINSTQDEVFVRYKISGTQMMLLMNAFSTLVTATTMLLPFPSIPILGSSKGDGHSELAHALEFIQTHPEVLRDILLFSAAGALGQLFIFDTLENFGSLTLVTITVTRKLFTMLLSLVVFNHTLTAGQWLGVCTVFAGIGIEAYVKRQESLEKKRQKQLKAIREAALAKQQQQQEQGGISVAQVNGHRMNGNAKLAAPQEGINGSKSGSVTPMRMKDV